MKKISLDLVIQIIIGIAGIGLALAGAIVLVASFFTPLPIFKAIALMALGVMLFNSSRLYFIFLENLNFTTELIKKITQANSPSNPDCFYPPDKKTRRNHPEFIEIKISDETTPEEIEEMKRKWPHMAEHIDMIMGMSKQIHPGGDKFPKRISLLSNTQLEQELKNAVENNEFELAAEIRDEIKKRKLKE